MNQKTLRFAAIFSFLFLLCTTSVLAGGGAITPVNFAYAQQITGKSFSPVVSVKDPVSNYSSPLVGKEFSFQAHGDLPGASCDTTQRTTDGQGQIKANCKADAYGKFVFSIIEGGSGQDQGSFEVYFTENGSGFSNQGSTGSYTVSISPGSINTIVGNEFSLEAQLKKDGQNTSNYDEVDFFRWEVLEGGIVIKSSKDDKNRAMNFMSADTKKTTLRVVVLMNNGSKVESGAIAINAKTKEVPQAVQATAAPTTAVPSTSQTTNSPTQNTNSSPKPTVSPKPALKKTTGSPSPSPTASASATPALDADKTAKLEEEINQLHKELADQQEQLNVLQRMVKSLREFISGMFW